MEALQSKIAIQINPNVYKKDPVSSELGIKIVREGILLLDELGFENFTFKKLAIKINSTEASIYRYFENKHNLLAYLTMWYWSWTENKIILKTLNIDSPEERLRRAIKCLTEEINEDKSVSHIDEIKLHNIVILESSKVYLCKTVQSDNESGFFLSYKSLVQRVADIILSIKPTFKYPHMLVSTIIEGAHHQRFFAHYLPRLTDTIEGEDAVTAFYTQLAERELNIEK
ncbi:MAG: TetR/AcrR family transcriptional regulator [Crocinitomicaceae bacterium]|nr:TetR/AcrR family transcriptional regulator [Crocinitomicaceae bacterium]